MQGKAAGILSIKGYQRSILFIKLAIYHLLALSLWCSRSPNLAFPLHFWNSPTLTLAALPSPPPPHNIPILEGGFKQKDIGFIFQFEKLNSRLNQTCYFLKQKIEVNVGKCLGISRESWTRHPEESFPTCSSYGSHIIDEEAWCILGTVCYLGL